VTILGIPGLILAFLGLWRRPRVQVGFPPIREARWIAPGFLETRRLGFARPRWPRTDDGSESGRSEQVPLRGV